MGSAQSPVAVDLLGDVPYTASPAPTAGFPESAELLEVSEGDNRLPASVLSFCSDMPHSGL